MDNFESLNLNINANDSASTILQNIISRLEKIKALNGNVTPTVRVINKYDQSTRYTQKNITKLDNSTKNYNRTSIKTNNTLKQTAVQNIDLSESTKISVRQTNKFVEANQRQNASLSDTAIRMGTVIMLARKLGQFFSSALRESGAYVENLNLFAVTFGKDYKETAQWALDLASNLGLANNEIIKFTGLFKQLSTAIGIADDTGTLMAKTLTQLGYDFASFYNIDITSAMEKLQAGIYSGQTKPLRSIGIDVTYQSIDNLLKTNEALAKFGTSSKKLDQSQKAIARLIIAMQSGQNAFGDMANTINTLSNQIRVLQGSFANFKLAVGDLIQKPLAEALVYVNAFIIALTNIIRKLAPINTTSKTGETQISQLGADAEETNEQIDKLTSKLASFDKFNALNSGEDKTNQAITEALTQELLKQQEKYDSITSSMEDMKNKSVELAKELEPLAAILGVTLVVAIGKSIGGLKLLSIEMLRQKGIAVTWGSVLKTLGNGVIIGTVIYSLIEMINSFKNGDKAAGVLYGTVMALALTAFAALNWQLIKTTTIKFVDFVTNLTHKLDRARKSIISTTQAITMTQIALAAMAGAFAIASFSKLWSSEGSFARKMTTTLIALAAAATAAGIAMAAFKQNWVQALSIAGLVAGGVITVSNSIKGFADGGYTNANLIATNENGTREWIGKQAGSSAIVNDTQMSDIMEVAVAKGVYSALVSNRINNNANQSETININIDGEKVFTAVKNKASQKGYTFAKV